MILSVSNINYNSNYLNRLNYIKPNVYNNSCPLGYDTVNFSGKSLPSEYKTVFDYLCAEILGKNKKLQVNGSMLSASKIKKAVKNVYTNNAIFENFDRCDYQKIKWKNYIPFDVRTYSVDKINCARETRLKEWAEALTSPNTFDNTGKELSKKLKNDDSLRLVIWDAVTSEIKTDNRHIPVPYNSRALLETIQRFESISPKDRAVTCAKPSFIEIYTHRLRDNLLMEMGLSNSDNVWVKIPSFRHDPKNKSQNIAKLEILSNKNWCTRSSVDKAEDALADGDFYIYLRRNKSFRIWEPSVGMTSSKGKIDQIQGKENDNIVPLSLLPEIKEFIKKSKLKCNSGVLDEGPKAWQALLISDKLSEKDLSSGKTFFKAIKDKDFQMIFKFLGIESKKAKNGLLKITNYKPVFLIDPKHGFTIPYSMFGINENELLASVESIENNLILNNKNKVFDSTITAIPKTLKSVGNKIICNARQFELFKKDIQRLSNDNASKIYIAS